MKTVEEVKLEITRLQQERKELEKKMQKTAELGKLVNVILSNRHS